MNCNGENTLQPINKRMYLLNSCRISGHFDTKFKFNTIAQIEQILQESTDLKNDNILNLERVYFLVTRFIHQRFPTPVLTLPVDLGSHMSDMTVVAFIHLQ